MIPNFIIVATLYVRSKAYIVGVIIYRRSNRCNYTYIHKRRGAEAMNMMHEDHCGQRVLINVSQ